MSIDRLQERIRKLKNPIVVEFSANKNGIPAYILDEERSFLSAYTRFATELLEGLSQTIAAVRFSFSSFAVLGTEGLSILGKLLDKAARLGYYVILDAPEALNAQQAELNAEAFSGSEALWKADALVICSYMGTDGLKAYCNCLKGNKQSLFYVVRTGNKSAPELQDLLSGTRLAHMAQADFANRLAEPYITRCGYCRLGVTTAATAPDSIRNLREKYRYLFLLVDGFDYPGANAKNCSLAFDRLGHGAAVCIGSSVTGAWMSEQSDGRGFIQCAVSACERINKNLARYITIL